MTIKVLLISAIDSKRRIEALLPPMNLAYLASYVNSRIKNEGIEFKIINCDYRKNIENYKPDFIGITSVTQNYPIAVDIASFCKKRGVPVFIGGIHISTLPSSLSKNFDFGIIGEGEETFLEIVNLFSKKKAFPADGLSKIDGLVFFDKYSKLRFTKSRKLIENIDSIPYPDRRLLGIKKHQVFIISSRGCPYNCYFCSSSAMWKRIRFNSAEYVIKDILGLIEAYKPEKIIFWDDLFIADKNRLRKIVERVEQLGINKKVCFHISASANLIDEETVSMLKRMNVWSVNIGFESGSEKVLKYLKGGVVSLKDSIRAINLLKKAGILVCGSFIIGSPIETKETLMETYDFIKKYKIDTFAVFPLTPYPKSKAWDYALENDLVSEHMDFSNLCLDYPEDYTKKTIISSNLSKKDLYQFHKKLLNLHVRRQLILSLKVMFIKPQSVFRNLLKRIRFKDFKSYN